MNKRQQQRHKRIIAWAEPAAVAALQACFAQFGVAGNHRALLAATDLFWRLAQATAASQDLIYPQALDNNVSTYVNELLTLQAGGSP